MTSRVTKSKPSSDQRKSQERKLKDSCDMCSASKVKCNKAKPLCGRCTKLQYPCFYSPARRIGRPHHQRLSSYSSPSHNSECETAANPNATTLPRQDSARPSIEQQFDQFGGDGTSPDYGEATMFVNGFHESGNHSPAMSPCNLMSDLMPSVQHGPTNYNHPGVNPSQDLTVHPVSDIFRYPLPLPTEETCNGHVTTNPDCSLIAAELLQNLDSISMMHHPRNSSSPTSTSKRFDDAMTTIASVILRASVILTCTCSGRFDVGLLCIAVCSSVLQIYRLILDDDPSNEPIGKSRKRKRKPENLSTTNDGMMRVLGELPRMALLVKQLSTRYSSLENTPCSDGDREAWDILLGLASTLKSNLQDLMHVSAAMVYSIANFEE